MRFARRFWDLLAKKEYDFERPDITLSNFHNQIYVTLAIQGIFYGKRDSYLRFVIPLINAVFTFVGVSLEGVNIYRGVTTADYSMACESFCYAVMITSIILVYVGLLTNKAEFLNLIEDMEHDFEQICSLGPRYREPFMANQLLVWKFYVLWTGFMFLSSVLFVAFPLAVLLYQNTIATQDEHMVRPLLFPLYWLPNDDPNRTPIYEAILAMEIFYVFSFNLGFSGYVYTLLHILLHNYTMMDMIKLDIESLFGGLDESVAILPKNNPNRVAVQLALNSRVGRIVTWHFSVYRAIKRLSCIYRPSMIYQLMMTSIIICLLAFQIAVKLGNGEIDLYFTLIGVAAIVQLWIPCYLGTVLRNKGFEVGEACWSCGWHATKLGRMIRTDITMILLQAQVPIFIKYTGQPVIQLETFSAIMSTAYSYFNMLMQSSK